MKRFQTNKQGFTLIEIAFSLAILSSAILIIMSGLLTAKVKQNEDEDLLMGVILANNKMVEVELQLEEDMARGKFPDEMSKSGVFEKPFDFFRFEYSIEKIEIPIADAAKDDGSSNAMIAQQIKGIMDQVSENTRELQVKVFWYTDSEAKEKEEIILTTHLVNLR